MVTLLGGAAVLASACGGSGSDDRGAAGSGNSSAGAGNNTAGSTPGGGAAPTAGGSSTAGTGPTCDSSTQCCPTAKCACPYPAADGTSAVIANSEDDKTMFKPGGVATAAGYWDLSKDASSGTITPAGTSALKTEAGGANGTAKALHVTGTNLTGWGAALAAELSNGCPFDGSKFGGISFWAKGTSTVLEGPNKLLVLVGNPEFIPSPIGFCDEAKMDPNCYARHRVTIDLTPEWKQYIVAWEDLKPPGYLPFAPAFGPNRIRDIVFNASGPSPMTTPAASFDFWIDELQFVPMGTKGNVGGGTGGSGAGGGSSAGAGGASAGAAGASAGAGGAAAGSGGTGG